MLPGISAIFALSNLNKQEVMTRTNDKKRIVQPLDPSAYVKVKRGRGQRKNRRSQVPHSGACSCGARTSGACYYRTGLRLAA